MKMFIHSVFGVLDCVPMTLQDIKKSIPQQPQTNQVDMESASDSCCAFSPETAPPEE